MGLLKRIIQDECGHKSGRNDNISMRWFDRYKSFERLCVLNSRVILNAASSSWTGVEISNTEPEIIREYLSSRDKGIGYLNNQLSPLFLLSGYEMKFGSVFVHQKPRITRINPHDTTVSSCELGDLLVVFSFLDRGKNPILNRALLLQAKKDFVIDNECQRLLYDEDRSFMFPAYIRSQSLCCNSSSERFLPGTYVRRWHALKYLIINGGIDSEMLFVPSYDSKKGSWAMSILGLMAGYDGLQFTRTPKEGQGWSAIVWDLISIVGNAFVGGEKRGSHLSCFADTFNDFLDNKKYYIEDEESKGLSVLFLFVKDKEISD